MAQRLRHRRKTELRLSLEEVAAKLPTWMGFDYSTLARVERGVRKVTYPELREIALVLGTTIGELDAQVDFVLKAVKAAGHGLPAPARGQKRSKRRK